MVKPREYEIYLKVKNELENGKEAPSKIVEISEDGIEKKSYYSIQTASKELGIKYQTLEYAKKHNRPVLSSTKDGNRTFFYLT